MNLNDLNARYALPGQLVFRQDSGGLIFAEIDNPLGIATLCLQGAHVTTWRPRDLTEPVVWVSEAAKYAPGKSIRGGVPICWPWFGPHRSEAGFPGHGFARTVPWVVTRTAALPGGETEIALMLIENEQARTQWPHRTRAELVVVVGASLKVTLATTNNGDTPVEIGEALHTYFRIGDIADIAITGLDGCTFVDKVDGSARKTQAGAVTCTGEVDRVYVNTEAACAIEDRRLGRRIVVAKSGSRSTVLWTPWSVKAEKMGDFGAPDGWRRTVCVESANALDNVVTVASGETHRMAVEYHAEAL